MATAVVTSRYSRTADRHVPVNRSPFRSCNPSKRYIAALEMKQKRQAEMEALETALAKTTDIREQRRLTTRLLATKNSLRSWEAYFEGDNEQDESCYREPRATQKSETQAI